MGELQKPTCSTTLVSSRNRLPKFSTFSTKSRRLSSMETYLNLKHLKLKLKLKQKHLLLRERSRLKEVERKGRRLRKMELQLKALLMRTLRCTLQKELSKPNK